MKKYPLLLFCLIFLGCNAKKIDLKDLKLAERPTVDLSSFSKHIQEQKGRYESATKDGPLLVDNGEKIVHYYFAGNHNATFHNAKLADGLETDVVTYDGIISFIKVHPDNREAGNLFTTLLKEYPAPDSIVYDQRLFHKSQKETAVILNKIMPYLVKDTVDEFNNKVTQYPQQLFWSKNDILTQLVIDPIDGYLNMSVTMVTKKGYLDHIVFEYVKPIQAEYDSPLKSLFKK